MVMVSARPLSGSPPGRGRGQRHYQPRVRGAQAPLLYLAVKGEKIHRAPHIGMRQERKHPHRLLRRSPVRGGARSPAAYAQPVVTFAYLTGWRVRSDVLTLQWRQVDFEAGIVQLDPGTPKNLEGRVFVMTPELRATLEAQRAVTEEKQQRSGSTTDDRALTLESAGLYAAATGFQAISRDCTIEGCLRAL